MRKSMRTGIALALVLMFVGSGLLVAVPNGGAPGASVRTASVGGVPSGAISPAHAVAVRASPVHPADAVTFPRTVLIETFTGVWCVHCPAESQALYDIDQNASKTNLIIAEIHGCAAPPPNCYDNYVDQNTETVRGTYYNVCGFPDVFFDGLNGTKGYPQGTCGASNSMPQMENSYLDNIHNASLWAGNVSIAQNSYIDFGAGASSTVVDHVNITSGLTGSYNVVTYLLQYIGKRNQTVGYGPHDVGNVVRQTLHDQPVSLTSGTTTPLTITSPLNQTWDNQNLSVISLVQLNSTKVVENANYAPVNTLFTGAQATTTNISSGGNSTITVTVTNATTGVAADGATVTMTDSAGGVFSPANGTTNMYGQFTTTFTAPTVTSTIQDNVTATASGEGNAPSTATVGIELNPLYPPSVPLAVGIVPGIGNVTVNWSAPATGGGGVTYYLWESSAKAGTYQFVTKTKASSYDDQVVTVGQTAWFEVSAMGPGGFSTNSTAISAATLAIVPQGLSAFAGWWISVDGQNFSASNSAALQVFMPAGYFDYSYGSSDYAFAAVAPASGEVVTTSSASILNLTFAPLLGTLVGTVTPAAATVVFNGSQLTVTAGAFTWTGLPGTYDLNVTAAGYTAKTIAVTLTPGNSTLQKVTLTAATSSTGGTVSSSGSGLSDTDIGIIAVIAVIAVAAVLGTVMMMSRRGGRPPKGPGNDA